MENFLTKVLPIANKYQLPITIGLFGLVFIAAGFIFTRIQFPHGQPILQTNPNAKNTFLIDVEGAVKKPGIYPLEEGKIVNDAIDAAGGFSEKADRDWVGKNINLADKVIDGQKLYIASIGEVSKNIQTSSKKININLASEAELDSLPGVGLVTAGKIVTARPFKAVDELKTKKVVNSSTFEKIKDLVSVN